MNQLFPAHRVAAPIAALLASLVLLGAGCIGAFNPTWRARDVINPKNFLGTWTLVKQDQEPVAPGSVKPWVLEIGKGSLQGTKHNPVKATVHDDESNSGELQVVFFKIGNEVFAESSPEGAGINQYVATHLLPRRLLHKVVLKGDELHVHILDADWFREHGATRLQSMEIAGAHTTIASADAWHRELKAESSYMFSKEPYLVLKRDKK